MHLSWAVDPKGSLDSAWVGTRTSEVPGVEGLAVPKLLLNRVMQGMLDYRSSLFPKETRADFTLQVVCRDYAEWPSIQQCGAFIWELCFAVSWNPVTPEAAWNGKNRKKPTVADPLSMQSGERYPLAQPPSSIVAQNPTSGVCRDNQTSLLPACWLSYIHFENNSKVSLVLFFIYVRWTVISKRIQCQMQNQWL